MNKVIILLAAFGLSACSSLFPYEDEFACKRPDNLGKCISSTEAYEEIKNGGGNAPYMKPVSVVEEEKENGTYVSDNPNPEYQKQLKISQSLSGYESYLDNQYQEMANLIQKPVTPLVNNAEVIEILILAYATNDQKRLKGERYINIINNNPEFILGDYLKKKPLALETVFDK